MNWIEALVLGVIQGLTEFLPVSSSGHLEIGQALFHTDQAGNLTFTIAVHAATVLSTICVFRKELAGLIAGCLKCTWNEEMRYAATLVVSMIPVFIVGVFFKDTVEQFFGNGLTLIGIMLLVTAVLLCLTHYAPERRKERISFCDAFLIGMAQACAVLPGLSRSGSTISTGLLLGNRKENVAQFSFLMVLVPVLGEAFLDLLHIGGEAGDAAIGAVPLAVGFAAAFISGLAACKWMLHIVRRSRLVWFAVYCALLGLITLFILR